MSESLQVVALLQAGRLQEAAAAAKASGSTALVRQVGEEACRQGKAAMAAECQALLSANCSSAEPSAETSLQGGKE